MEYVKIRDKSIKDKKFQNLYDYEKMACEENFKGFNLIYGNVISG
jgi:hypothetical protein